ncbi:MAG: AMP-binding protein [Bacteroidales bacterium]|nr:AMP-binding protein [Bacteroidales bacterium]
MKHYLKKLEEQVHLHPEKPALCDYGGQSYTYGEVAATLEQYALFFEAAGIRKGDKIALVGRNSARWAQLFLAVNIYEAVIVPIVPIFTPEGTAQLIRHSDSVLLLADPDIWHNLQSQQLPQVRAVISAREDVLLWSADARLSEAWERRGKLFAKKYPRGFQPAQVCYPDHLEALAIINYTSGTSGDPKGVMLSFGSMSDIVEYCQGHIGNKPDVLVSMLPLAHIYGLAMEFIYPCCTGYSIYFLGKTPSPTLLLQSMQEIRPNLIVTVPLIMEKLYSSLIRPMLSTPAAKAVSSVPYLRLAFYKGVGKKVLDQLGGRVKTLIIGGAPLSWKVESVFKKIELPYTVGYGLTEGCPLLSFEMPGRYVSGSCGKAIHEIRIDSSDPERIPGEIQSRGPNITLGYYKNPEADVAARTADGWFRTGDLGVMDEGGNVFIRGRIKALILSASGQNIYPEEVEQVLLRHPLVEEALVLDRGGKVVALVYPRGDAASALTDEIANDLVSTEIRNQTNLHLPKFSQIFRVEIVDVPFERTPKGSIKRHLYQ